MVHKSPILHHNLAKVLNKIWKYDNAQDSFSTKAVLNSNN